MMNKVDFKNVKITGGFWKQKQDLARESTIYAVYDRFKETGRFDALKCDPNAEKKAHIFWDSDVAKWIEGVAYLLVEKKNDHLQSLVDSMIDDIVNSQEECGYFNSYYLVNPNEERFTNRDNHAQRGTQAHHQVFPCPLADGNLFDVLQHFAAVFDAVDVSLQVPDDGKALAGKVGAGIGAEA